MKLVLESPTDGEELGERTLREAGLADGRSSVQVVFVNSRARYVGSYYWSPNPYMSQRLWLNEDGTYKYEDEAPAGSSMMGPSDIQTSTGTWEVDDANDQVIT